jgi:hypothetical protein
MEELETLLNFNKFLQSYYIFKISIFNENELKFDNFFCQ